MPKFNPDNLNIHELAIEEPEKESELLFDPDRDMIPADWEMINKHIESCKGNGPNLISFLLTSKLCGREIKLEEKEWEEIIDDCVNRYNEDGDGAGNMQIDGGANFFYQLRALNPNVNEKYQKLIRPDNISPIEKALKSCRDKHELYWLPKIAAGMAVMGLDAKLTLEEKEEMKAYLENYRHENQWLAEYLSDLRLLGVDAKVTKNDWEKIFGVLERFRVNIGVMGAETAKLFTDMAILSADEVHIPEGGGLELIHHKKDLQTECPQIPEQKQF